MPLPGWLAGFNRRVTNRVAKPLVETLPGFAVVMHTGEVMAARWCEVQTRGRTIRLEEPRVVTHPRGSPIPAAIRPILKAFRVTQFMELKESRHPGP
jgi:hypothetical protein